MRSLGPRVDPMTDRAAAKVLVAYEAAHNARKDSCECYLAGVDAWHRAHPYQTRPYAAQQAVAVIFASKVRLRVEDA
jgi:hypothetical protein